METVKLKTVDPASHPSGDTQQPICDNEDKLKSTRKMTYMFSTQPLETDLKKLLTQVTGKIDLASITEVKLKVVSGQAGLHRLSDYTPHLRTLTLDGSCIASFRDLGSSLKSLTTLSVVRCSLKHLDGVWGFGSLEYLNVSENYISDPSPCSGVRKLSKLDIRRNQITDLSYFAFFRSCRKLKELYVTENQFSDYKEEITKLIPQLMILDGEEIRCFYPPGAGVGTDTGFVSDDKNHSSEGGSSTSLSLSVEDINLAGRQSMDDLEEGDVEKSASASLDDFRNQIYSSANDSEDTISADKIIAHDSPPGRLSCRVICGNLAASLRARNPTKLSQSLAVLQQPMNVSDIKDVVTLVQSAPAEESQDDLKLDEANQEDQGEVIDAAQLYFMDG